MSKTDIRNFALLGPLLYLYQNIFLWSKNVSMFTVSQLLYSFGAILIISALIYFLIYSLCWVSLKKNNKWLYRGVIVSYAVFIGIISNYLFLRTIFYPHNHIYMYLLILGIILIGYLKISKYFLKFCYLLLLFAFCSFAYNAYSDFNKSIPDTDNFVVELKDKPNIYMFWLESFQGARTLENVYSIDVSPLSKFLEENNFTVCENIYSSSGFTLASMTDLFSLGDLKMRGYQTGNFDTNNSVRRLLGGGDGNNLLKVLKYNDYLTNFINPNYYLFLEKGQYLDFATIDQYTNFLQYLYPCYAFCKHVNKILTYCAEQTVIFTYDEYISSNFLLNAVECEIDRMQQMNKPYFLTFKGGAFHSGGTYSGEKRNNWIKSSAYKEAIERSIMETEEIVSLIIKKDPNALIVILGDHGAYISGTDLHNGIPVNVVADDNFNVYGAVRLPPQYAPFSFDGKGTYINHTNIFIHIFSLLAQKPDYLQLQKIPESRLLLLPKKVIIENGIINKDFSFE